MTAALRYHPGMPIDMKSLARVGAQARLGELRDEMNAILRVFPDLRRSAPAAARGRTDDGLTVIQRRKRKAMTPSQKKAVGERMRRYWAARKKAEQKG